MEVYDRKLFYAAIHSEYADDDSADTGDRRAYRAFSAIYLVEYSNRGSKFQMTLVKIIRMTTETCRESRPLCSVCSDFWRLP